MSGVRCNALKEAHFYDLAKKSYICPVGGLRNTLVSFKLGVIFMKIFPGKGA